MRLTREECLARLRKTVSEGKPIVGTGAGTGISAKCAEAGSADLIIIYNSGRYRMGGRGSLAGLMPLSFDMEYRFYEGLGFILDGIWKDRGYLIGERIGKTPVFLAGLNYQF